MIDVESVTEWQKDQFHVFASFSRQGESGQLGVNGTGEFQVLYDKAIYYRGKSVEKAVKYYNKILPKTFHND